MNDFFVKCTDKTATVGILGLGYVGIPLAMRIAEIGLKVIGFDILEQRIEELNAGQSPIQNIPHSDIAGMVDNGFEATSDFARVSECDAIIICVPTPLSKSKEPDLSFVTSTMDTVTPYLRAGQLLSLESTTWPGTTREVLLPYVESVNLKAGENFFLVYSPEREDPGNEHFSTRSIPKVVGGYTEQCLKAGVALYSMFIDNVVEVSSTDAAEMVKLLENIHRSVNIGLANEMKVVASAMGLDIFEIVDAAKTKPFGFTAYYPGPGIGGHCIPIDPFYLTWKAREFGLHTRFIELSGEINRSMPEYVVRQLISGLNERKLPLNGSKVLVLGIAYKSNIDDVRESPSVHIMELLRDNGADVSYSDPYVQTFPKMREHSFDLSSVELSADVIKSYDAIILATNHSDFDYEMIKKEASLIVDTRGVYSQNCDNVVRA